MFCFSVYSKVALSVVENMFLFLQVFSSQTVQHTLSLMLSCGLYDYSGQFAFHVRRMQSMHRVDFISLLAIKFRKL